MLDPAEKQLIENAYITLACARQFASETSRSWKHAAYAYADIITAMGSMRRQLREFGYDDEAVALLDDRVKQTVSVLRMQLRKQEEKR